MGLDLNDLMAQRMLLVLPGMEEAEVRKDLVYKADGDLALHMDVYRPREAGEARLPAVIFVSGNASPELMQDAKEWGAFVSGAQLVTTVGAVGVTFNKRAWSGLDLEELERAAGDVEDAIDYVREHASELGIDPDRLALWVFSAGPPTGLRRALRDTPEYLRCLVVYYGVMDLRGGAQWPEEERGLAGFSPVTYLEDKAGEMAPTLLVRCGQDNPRLNRTVEDFVGEGLRRNAPLEVINFPEGHHGFDVLDDLPETRGILRRTLGFCAGHLRGSEGQP